MTCHMCFSTDMVIWFQTPLLERYLVLSVLWVEYWSSLCPSPSLYPTSAVSTTRIRGQTRWEHNRWSWSFRIGLCLTQTKAAKKNQTNRQTRKWGSCVLFLHLFFSPPLTESAFGSNPYGQEGNSQRLPPIQGRQSTWGEVDRCTHKHRPYYCTYIQWMWVGGGAMYLCHLRILYILYINLPISWNIHPVWSTF